MQTTAISVTRTAAYAASSPRSAPPDLRLLHYNKQAFCMEGIYCFAKGGNPVLPAKNMPDQT